MKYGCDRSPGRHRSHCPSAELRLTAASAAGPDGTGRAGQPAFGHGTAARRLAWSGTLGRGAGRAPRGCGCVVMLWSCVTGTAPSQSSSARPNAVSMPSVWGMSWGPSGHLHGLGHRVGAESRSTPPHVSVSPLPSVPSCRRGHGTGGGGTSFGMAQRCAGSPSIEGDPVPSTAPTLRCSPRQSDQQLSARAGTVPGG